MKTARFSRAVQYLGGHFLKLRALLIQPVLDLVLDHTLSVPLLLAVHQVTEHPELFISYRIS